MGVCFWVMESVFVSGVDQFVNQLMHSVVRV